MANDYGSEWGVDPMDPVEDPNDPKKKPAQPPAAGASDPAAWSDRLQQAAKDLGVRYDDSDTQDVTRQVSYAKNAGVDPETFVSQAVDKMKARAGNTPSGGDSQPTTVTQGWLKSDPTGASTGDLADLYTRLKSRMDQSLNVSASDPTIRAQADPYRAATERQRRDWLSSQAEKAGSTANLTAEDRLSRERAGQAIGSYEGELIGREVAARRDEIAKALDTYAGLLTGEQERSLKMELAQLDAQLQRDQLNQQQNQFLARLGLDAEQQASYWDWIRGGGTL